MEASKKESLEAIWKPIAAKAIQDLEFRKKLVADPVGVMTEHGLKLPEGAEMKIGAGNLQTIPIPSNASEELKEEVSWWMWRLNSIQELGKELPKKKAGHLSMSAQEADDDASGVF